LSALMASSPVDGDRRLYHPVAHAIAKRKTRTWHRPASRRMSPGPIELSGFRDPPADPQLSRRAAEARSEGSAEMGRVVEAAGERDLADAACHERWIAKVAP